jgi:hypothetical protein
MNEPISEKETKNSRRWTALLIVLLIAAVAIILWLIFGKNNKQANNTSSPSPQSSQQAHSGDQINSAISYQLPNGWNTVTCNNPTEVILIVPQGKVSPDCATLAANWPMKIMIDPMNTTDCSQIKVNAQQVTNHICSSQSINGSKFFVSSTTYNDKSSYGKNVKASDYYVKTSSGVVKLEYADDLTTSEDDYQAQFDQIANSIKVK